MLSFTVEQIKSSPENREKILAAARKAQRTSNIAQDMNEINYYVKENNVMAVDEFKKQFHKLMHKKEERIIMNRSKAGNGGAR